MATIQLKNIQKVYSGDVLAVKDLSLDIDDEEFIVLIGPSGCGKSTILRMIAGLEDITSGDLIINDKVVNEIAPKDRDIAMVFQNYALYPHMTVFNNMAFSLQLKKLPKDVIKTKVEETAKLLDIEHLLERKPKALSGGQRQRVALGRAMVRDPAIFLLDEPLSNLDAKLRITMRAEIIKLHRQLKKQGTTFVYVTHDQVEAMTMADRIVILKDGILQQVDTPQQVYDNPINLFVAGFIGSPPMNFLRCTIQNQDIFYKNTLLSTLETPIEDIEEVIVGIRPEYLQLIEEKEATKQTTFSAEVKFVETMGSETYLYSEIHETELVTRISSDKKIKEGDTVCFAIDNQKLHLFDITTEERIVR